MTEPLDLDALERQLFWADGRPSERAGEAIASLVSELRATRAEFEQADLAWTEWEIRAHQAEAAIARVEALCASWSVHGHGQGRITRAMAANIFRAALRGDDD